MNNLNTSVIDYKYIKYLSNRLEGFKDTGRRVFIARCPVCGDSTKKKHKKRLYIFEKEGTYRVFCHNCGYSSRLGWFLKDYFNDLYREYLFDCFAENGEEIPKKEIVSANPVVQKNDNLKGLIKISKLSPDHPAKKYVVDRQIPTTKHFKLFFTPHFAKWVNTKRPGTLYDKQKIDPRLVLPLLDREGNCFGVQGRDLTGKSDLRYITIRFDESFPKVFGLEDFDPNYKGYVLEGPIDSLFLNNAIAMAGADIPMEDVLAVSNGQKERIVRVYDNEPRNKDIHKRMEKAIEEGYNVVIWPSFVKQKDINDIFKAGLNPQKIIDDHTYHGLSAELEFASWKKT